ncbi:hypothetical protein MBLNU457_4474t2 [Dothideomycetes sp. NU457]
MFPRLSFQRSRTAPTGYEKVRILFHSIRTAQLLSSLITGIVLIYFIWWLIHDHYATPWTFIVLITVSLLTVLFLTATIVFHYMTGLSPRLNIVLNTTLFCLWAMGFGMLAYYMSGTLSHYCNTATWENDAGVMKRRNTATRGPYTDDDHRDHEDIEGRVSDAFELPQGAHDGASYKGLYAQGYSVPEAQFAYGEDTGYHGGHEESALRALD